MRYSKERMTRILALIKEYQRHYPKVFDCKTARPLAIGIDKVLIAKGEHSKTLIRDTLAFHTTRDFYMGALVHSKHRYDLDGNRAGEVSAEHKNKAVQVLKTRAKLRRSARAQQAPAPIIAVKAAPGKPVVLRRTLIPSAPVAAPKETKSQPHTLRHPLLTLKKKASSRYAVD